MQENITFGYTYTKDGNTDWSGKENIVGQDCAVGTYSDREMTTSTNDTTITACYGTCTVNEFCPAFDLIDVTFAVNMQYEQLDETGVFLHGGWFGWGTMAMSDDDANGVYEITIPDMTSGSTIEFKFMNGADVEIVPADCDNINDWGGGINRMYTLSSENTTIGPICFGGCVDCAPAGPVDVTFNVDMSGVDGFDGTEAPYVFGSFNNWDSFGGQTMLADEDGDNVYTGTVNDLMSDAEITLLFGYGANYETVPEECGILDSDLDAYVRLLPLQDAGGNDVLVLDAIPYGGCPTGGPASGIVFSGSFGGAVVDGNTYTVPTGSEAWAGFANEDATIYPFSFPNGGAITFTGATAGTDVDLKFMFQYQPHPNNVPEFETATVTVSGTAEIAYSVAIPAQDAANTYSSFLLYVTTLDAAVTLTNVAVTMDQLSNEEGLDKLLPTEFSYKTYPNPFNPVVNIYYELPESDLVNITIVDLLGRQVRTLVNDVQNPGFYKYQWDGKDSYGLTVQSSIYFAVINRQSGIDISKITFLK
jgi:hypothetical protein